MAPSSDVAWVILASVVIVPIVLMITEIFWRYLKPAKSMVGAHVVIVGGSQGIGLAMAMQAAGKKVRGITLISRSMDKLEKAKEAIEKAAPTSSCDINLISADATHLEEMEKAMMLAVDQNGAPDYLICAAGASHPGYFLEQSVDTFRSSMELNYMGTVTPLKVAIPHMVARGGGHCCLVSSGAGISGWLGYSTYSPTKFAVRGLAEALRNELRGFNISVSIAYPPDTDTPGFAEENKTKPVENIEMLPPSTYSPDAVATYIWYSLGRGDFNCSCPDILQDFLIALMSGVTPRRLYIFDVLIHPLCIVITTAFRWNADRIACKYPKRISDDERAIPAKAK